MRYVALVIDVHQRFPIDGPLHTLAGFTLASKVTGCGLSLPNDDAEVYEARGIEGIGPHCGDCFPQP